MEFSGSYQDSNESSCYTGVRITKRTSNPISDATDFGQSWTLPESTMAQEQSNSWFQLSSTQRLGEDNSWTVETEAPSEDVNAVVASDFADFSKSMSLCTLQQPLPSSSPQDSCFDLDPNFSHGFQPSLQGHSWPSNAIQFGHDAFVSVPHYSQEYSDTSHPSRMEPYSSLSPLPVNTGLPFVLLGDDLLSPEFSPNSGTTHSRNSSLSQSSLYSGSSSPGALSDMSSLPATPLSWTPASAQSELPYEPAPSTSSSPLSRSSSYQKALRKAAKSLESLVEKYGPPGKVLKQRSSANHQASEARRNARSMPIPCPVEECEETFTRNSTLNDHLKRHFRKKEHKCERCSFATNKYYDLKRHKDTSGH